MKIISIFLLALCLVVVPAIPFGRQQIDFPTQIKRMPWFDVRSYGAVGDGVTDDTAAIQAAINAARTAAGGQGAAVFLPAATKLGGHTYQVSSLDATNFNGLTMFGNQTQGVTICGSRQTVSRPILDLTGSSAVILSGLIFSTCGIPPVLPTVGVLMASSNTASSNKNRMDNVGITGNFVWANLFLYGTTDNIFIGCAHQSQQPGTSSIVITGDNAEAVISPYTTIASGPQNTGEMTFIQQEAHDLAPTPPSGTATVRIRNAYAIRWYGGNISNAGIGHVYFQGSGPIREITFDGPQLYTDGVVLPSATFYSNNSLVQNLHIRNVYFANAVGPIISGPGTANTVFKGLQLTGIDSDLVGVPINIGNLTPATTASIQNAYLDLGGKGFTPGGSVLNTVLMNPGPITLQAGATWDNVIPPATFAFAALPPTVGNGGQVFCSNCLSPSSPCAGGGTGALAARQNGAWKCF